MNPTNFGLLRREVADIIVDIRDGDGPGQPSTITTTRKTLRLINEQHISVTEKITPSGTADQFQYDWILTANHYIKFHSEPHPLDKRYQTPTEPYHIHHSGQLSSLDRLSNTSHRDLFTILEMIRIHFLASGIRDQ